MVLNVETAKFRGAEGNYRSDKALSQTGDYLASGGLTRWVVAGERDMAFG